MNINYKRSLKLMTLIATALLIATASATMYYTMSISGTVTVAATIRFVQGADWPTGSSIGTGSTSASLVLKAYLNSSLVYTEALKVNNTATGTPSIRLRHVSISNSTDGKAGNFTYVNIVLLDDGDVQKGYLNYTGSGNYFTSAESTNYSAMDASDVWKIRIETKADASATADVAVTLSIAIDVQE